MINFRVNSKGIPAITSGGRLLKLPEQLLQELSKELLQELRDELLKEIPKATLTGKTPRIKSRGTPG